MAVIGSSGESRSAVGKLLARQLLPPEAQLPLVARNIRRTGVRDRSATRLRRSTGDSIGIDSG